jgi:hypothetical protein
MEVQAMRMNVEVVELPAADADADADALAEARAYLQRAGLVLEGDETPAELLEAYAYLLAGENDG